MHATTLSLHRIAKFVRPKSLILAGSICAMAGGLAPMTANGQGTALAAGDIQVVGATADSNDSFTFVLWRNIAAGTVIRFMDHSFNSAAATHVTASENDMSITFSSSVNAGTVIRWENTVNGIVGATGTVNGALSGLSNDGDQIFIYQGSAIGSNDNSTSVSGRTLLYGYSLAESTWLSSGSSSAQQSFRPSALAGIDHNIDNGNFENLDYTGARTGMTTAAYRAAVANPDNATGNDTRFNLSTTNFTSTSTVDLVWDANGKTAGTGGTGTWNKTTQSRFSNTANNTFLHWVDSAAGSGHSTVFAGTAGTVTVGEGVTTSEMQFDVNGYTVSGSQTITMLDYDGAGGADPTIQVTNAAHTAKVNAPVSSTATDKTGAGTLEIGTASFSGAIDVVQGRVSGNGTSSTNAAGLVTVRSGASIDPGLNAGTGVGKMKSGNFSLLSGGAITLQLGGTVAVTQHDQIEVTGTLSLAGSLTGSLINGYLGQPLSGETLFIILNDGTDAVVGGFANTFTLDGQNAVSIGGSAFYVSYVANSATGELTGGNDVALSTVPEPSTMVALLGGLGFAGLLRPRRRR